MSVAPRRRRLRAAAAAVVVLAAIAIASYWYLNLGPGQASPPGATVLEFNGSGNRTTEPFFVRPGWRIEWENTAERFSFAITGDLDFGTVVDQQEPGSGVTSPSGSGTYQLEVTAEGPWSITVVQGD